MGENIEVKDIQKTEYLDKNGLAMLWAKIKENTHNQVEVEYNRAQAVEGDITNKLDNLKYIPYVSKTNMNSSELGDFVKYQLGATEFIISAQHGSNDARTEFRFGEVNFISRSKDSAVSIDCEGVTAGIDNNIKLTNTGIRKYINSFTPAGSATEAFSTDGGVIDTTAFALKSELDSYAKKTDIPEVDTSDFISKTATDVQYINSTLGILGGNMISVIDYTADGDPVSLELASTGLEFNGSNISTIELNGSDVNSNNGSRIIIEAHNENPQIALLSNVGSDYAFSDNLTITNKGISNTDNNANHVYATDGSIADLTQYANAAALNNYVLTTALDKQVDTLNAAISGKQDAGNYIPYKNIAPNNKYVIESSYSIEFRTDTLNNKYGKAFIGPQSISVTNASGQVARIESEEIQLRQSGNVSGRIHSTLNADSFGVYNNNDDSVIFKLNQYGIKLEDGDNNHVLTSNASTIDITQYVLKSVYDEKIAALEARIAALEAKHTETA